MKNRLLSFLTICIMFTFVICVQNTIAKEEEPAKKAMKAEDQAAIDTQRAKVQEILEQRRKTRKLTTRSASAPKDKKSMDRKRLKMMDQQIEQRKQEHTDFIGELKAAKKLALKENATKTAKKLDDIIKNQEQRFNKTRGSRRQSRDRVRKQFQKENLPAAPGTSTDESAEQPKKKKARWWKFWR